MSMSTKKSTYHHGNLREVLISSALEILKEGTLQDLSLRALARKAGVSQTAPYRHFEDKRSAYRRSHSRRVNNLTGKYG